MKPFEKPLIYSILSENLVFLRAQATGGPTNPTLDCLAACCNNLDDINDSADFVVTWNDDPGTPVGNFSVDITLEGSAYTINDGTAGCSIVESPAGTYTLTCSNTVMASFDCNCSIGDDTLQVVSINDGVNTLQVGLATCELEPCTGC